MRTAAPCADSARPPGSTPSVHNPHDQLPTLTKESKALNPPMTQTQPQQSAPRRRRRQTQNHEKSNHFHWKETLHRYTPTQKKLTNAHEPAKKISLLPPPPNFRHPCTILFLAVVIAIAWLRAIASDLQQIIESCQDYIDKIDDDLVNACLALPAAIAKDLEKLFLSTKIRNALRNNVKEATKNKKTSPTPTIKKFNTTDYLIPHPRPKTIQPPTRTELPMTTSLLPYVHAADIITNPREKSESVLSKKDVIYWNVMFDPTTDQLQVYANGRVRLYRRQRKSHRFVYLRCKTDSTFSKDSKIVLGNWQDSYFILLRVIPRPLHRKLPSKPDLKPVSPNTSSLQDRKLPVSPQPSYTEPTTSRPIRVCRQKMPPRFPSHIDRICSRLLTSRSQITTDYASDESIGNGYSIPLHESPETSILRLSQRHLAAYFSIAEVILEQNVDPG